MTYTAEQLRRDAIAIERMHGETLTVEWRGHQASQLRAHSDALEENARLRAEANDDDALRERMADILTRTAAALKGEPEPLTLHDWSGLPEIAERAVSELAKLRQHAEAMYQAWESVEILPRDNDARIIAVCAAYRADFPEGK